MDRSDQRHSLRWSAAQAVRDSIYILVGWPILLCSFISVATLLPTGVALAILWVGIPIVVLALAVAHALAQVEVHLQRTLLGRTVKVQPGQPAPTSVRRAFSAIRQPARIGELVLAVGGWVPGLFLWTVAVTWWACVLALLLAPVWHLHGQYSAVASLLHVPGGYVMREIVDVAVGLLLLGLTPWVMRIMALIQSTICAFLLEAPVKPLRAAAREREQRARLQASQSAEANALRRLERDIHDGPQQRLVRLQLDLARAERLADEPVKSREILTDARAQAQEALDELRATSRGVAPQVLTEYGLARACEEIAGRCPLPMRTRIDLPRLDAPSETALCYVVSEAVTNVAKHANAHEVRVEGYVDGAWAVVRITDDGSGGAHPGKGSGLIGLEHRLAALGGRMTIHSPSGGPTVLEGRVPCAS